MILLLLFLQKQNLAFTVYLFGSVLSLVKYSPPPPPTTSPPHLEESLKDGSKKRREKVSFINENTPRAPTGTKNTRKPARLAILR